jgi:hypothetical protein
MKKKETFTCDKCELEFDDEQECIEHEEFCGKSVIVKCDKCGKEEDIGDDEYGWKSEGWYNINLGRQGYGSGLDGCDVQFLLCDDCLIELVRSFTWEGQEKVLNSGSNSYLSSEDWIKLHKGEMSDKEMEEFGFYSPRQVNAYKERFPICDKVNIIEYKDGSRGSRCPKMAFGDEHGNCGLNTSSECFECPSFKEREEGKEIPIKFDDRY